MSIEARGALRKTAVATAAAIGAVSVGHGIHAEEPQNNSKDAATSANSRPFSVRVPFVTEDSANSKNCTGYSLEDVDKLASNYDAKSVSFITNNGVTTFTFKTDEGTLPWSARLRDANCTKEDIANAPPPAKGLF